MKRRSKCARTTDKATAERIGAKFEADAALRRDGVINAGEETVAQQSRRSIAEHLADFEAKMRAANRTAMHVSRTIAFVEQIATFANFTVAGDISADGLNRYARHLQDQGKSARTIHSRLTAMKSFTRWLADGGKLAHDPLAIVRKPSLHGKQTHRRRMLLPEEWPLLEAATLSAPVRYGMDGDERVLLYRTAIQSGLRAAELRSLRRTSLVLDAPRPFIRLEGSDAKNGHEGQQFIDRSLADVLKVHSSAKLPTAKLFNLPHESNLARMLRSDLEAARDAWIAEAAANPAELIRRQQSDFLAVKDHRGHVLDFHSLRHTCGSWLAISGAHPKTVQSVLRHSTITLTMDTYGHLLPGAEAEAADRLGAMVSLRNASDDDEEISLKMTGTDAGSAQRQAQQLGRESGRRHAKGRESATSEQSEYEFRNSVPALTLGDEVPCVAAVCESSPARIRTWDQGIMSPLL